MAAEMFCSTTRMVWPACGERAAGGEQIAHDDRRQALERLVEQQDLRLAHERARDREHLLLAAREVGAAAACAAP